MSHYGVNPLRRTSVPFALQPQQPPSNQWTTGDNNVQILARSQSPQIGHTRPPSNPRTSAPGRSDQGRNLATSNPAPSVAPSLRPNSTTERRREVPQAQVIDVETPVQSSKPADKSYVTNVHGTLPAGNTTNTISPPNPYNSASRTTIDLHPKSQAQTKAKKPSSTPNKPSPQNPVHSAPSSVSHPATNAITSSMSAPPRSAAHAPENSTTSPRRVSSTQSASADLNHPGHSSSTLPATKSVTSPQPRPSSTPTSLATSPRHSSEPNQSKHSNPMGPKTSDTPARNSSVQPNLNLGQEARTQGQSSPSIRPQAPLRRSVSVPQQTHGAMQPPPRPARMPTAVVHQPPAPSSHQAPPANSEVTRDRDRDISRGSQSSGVASRPASSTTSSSAPPKQISEVISNALRSIKRKWTQHMSPQESPAQNGTSTQRDMPAVERSTMPPNKMPRLEDGVKQGQSLKAIESDNPLKKIYQGTPSTKRHRFPTHSQIRHRGDLVQPIDSNDTDPRDAYNPATIARDVLIVAAKHPTEGRLNDHLAIIMKNFPHIDSSKDLATLRWDLIDPVVPPDELPHTHRPPPAPVHTQQIHAPQMQQMHVPTTRPPQTHAPQTHVPPSTAPQIHAPVPNHPTPLGYRPIQYYPQPSYYSPYPGPHYPLHSIPGRIPPPPTYSFPPPLTPSLSLATPQAPTPSYSAPAPAPAPKPKPQPKTTPIPKPTAYKQSKLKKPEGAELVKATPPPQPQVVVDVSPRQKKSLESPRAQKHPSLQVVVNSPRKMNQPKQRGRPRKDANNAKASGANDKKPLPEFLVFNCLWANCQAELHNLNNLQDHVLKKHVPHNLLCGWENCENQTPMAAAAMWEHVQDSHIKPIRWSHGDGPTVPVIGENIDLQISAGLLGDTGA